RYMNIKLLTILFLTFMVSSFAVQAQNYHLLIGTYTNGGNSEGIYVYKFNSTTGKLNYKSMVPINNPSYITISHDRKFVYSVSEDSTNNVNAFAFNPNSGSLTYLNKQSSGGGGPTYISIDS